MFVEKGSKSFDIVSESPVKRHLIKSPPPNYFFGGGEKFLGYLHQFWVLEQKQKFGKSMELTGVFDMHVGQFLANSGQFMAI